MMRPRASRIQFWRGAWGCDRVAASRCLALHTIAEPGADHSFDCKPIRRTHGAKIIAVRRKIGLESAARSIRHKDSPEEALAIPEAIIGVCVLFVFVSYGRTGPQEVGASVLASPIVGARYRLFRSP
jgi:hypothetical protein